MAKKIYGDIQMTEYFQLHIDYLRFASGGSIENIKERQKRSDFHKYSIFKPGLSGLGLPEKPCAIHLKPVVSTGNQRPPYKLVGV
jgi:hypothetical protein